ncbi:mitochondrial PGP phosphatase-domain-containing protein [Trametes gibbosa]|nr:mitochondrial PGP phosphatase-domain-containing protein [Trametes gibbosa]
MPFNLPGVLVPFHLLINPRLIVPSIVVKDIRQLDFPALYKAGYRGAVFDKDNCLTIPHEDRLVPELTEAWRECKETFGQGNVLIVSNAAGSHLDDGEIEGHSVSHHLSAPVLRHTSLKPSYACIKSIRTYFASLPRPVKDDELVIVGDRLLTDIILANRMARRAPSLKPKAHEDDIQKSVSEASDRIEGPARVGPLAVWTEGLWKRENLVLRALEGAMLKGVERWALKPQEAAWYDSLQRRFVKPAPVPVEKDVAKEGWVRKLVRRIRS